MLESTIITAAYLGNPEPAPRISACGRSAVAFDEMVAAFSCACASPGLALWMAWERRTNAEALQRIRELH